MAIPIPSDEVSAPAGGHAPLLGRAGLAFGLLLLALAVRLPRLGIPFTANHDFRQTQTATAVQAFLDDGVRILHYETPVFGPPWMVPFEFPTFQLSAYPLARLGLSVELATRVAALAWFLASALLLLAVARRWTDPITANVSLAIYLFSPFALLWSRACLIDYASVALSLAYLLCAGRWAVGARAGAWVAAVAAGALASATKITTLPVVLPGLALVVGHACLERVRREGLRRALPMALAAAGLVIVPLAAGVAWTAWADHVKASSPATAWMTSRALSGWNFGSLQQRLGSAGWDAILWRIHRTLLPTVLTLPLVVTLAVAWRRRGTAVSWAILAALAGAVLPVVTFFNLYDIHDYYLIAVSAPLALLAGAGVVGVGRLPMWGSKAIAVALLVLSPWSMNWRYAKDGYADRSADPLLALARQVAAITPPDRWVVVEGDDWNPRILYWAHRRGFYLKPGQTTAQAMAGRTEVATLVCRDCPPEMLAVWPERRPAGTEAGFRLFTVGPHP